MPELDFLYMCNAADYGLPAEQTALLDRLFSGHTVRACTPDAGAFSATVGTMWNAFLPFNYLDITPDSPRAERVRGRIIDASTLAGWVSQIEPLPDAA